MDCQIIFKTMSIKIGIVSEGVSDFRVLKHIIERYLKDFDVYTVPLKPKVTNKGKQDRFGTWQGVFEYISGEDEQQLINEAVKEDCGFVIIQIDTDVCDEYKVSKETDNIELLWNTVKQKLNESVHKEFDKTKLIYAICIHDIECWLIPFVCREDNSYKTIENCVNKINRQIQTEGTIDKDNKNHEKTQRVYDYILKQKKKPSEILDYSKHNYGFSQLIN